MSHLLNVRPREVITARPHHTVADIIGQMKQDNISQMPVVNDDGSLIGMITEVDLLDYLLSGAGQMDHPIADIVSTDAATVGPDTSIDALGDIFTRGHVAVVVDESDRVRGIVTKIDMIDYLANKA